MSEIEMTDKIVLQPVLKSADVTDLWSQVNMLSGKNIVLDCSKVEKLGARCLEVLISAQSQWKKSGKKIEFCNSSEAFTRDVKILGAEKLISLSQNEVA